MTDRMIEIQFATHAKNKNTGANTWFNKGTRACLTKEPYTVREPCMTCGGSIMKDVEYYEFEYEGQTYTLNSKFAVEVSPSSPGTGPLPSNDDRINAMGTHIPGDGYNPDRRRDEFNAMGVIDIRNPNKVFTPEEAAALRNR